MNHIIEFIMAAYNSILVHANGITGLTENIIIHSGWCFYFIPGPDWFLYRPRFDIVQTNMCCISNVHNYAKHGC